MGAVRLQVVWGLWDSFSSLGRDHTVSLVIPSVHSMVRSVPLPGIIWAAAHEKDCWYLQLPLANVHGHPAAWPFAAQEWFPKAR